MVLFPALLALAPPAPGVRVTVAGEGKLRFAVGRTAATATAATLSASPQGLLVDETGRPVAPAIRVGADAFRIAMNGTVTVSGKLVGRLVLERLGKGIVEFGYPGEDGFGIVHIAGPDSGAKATPDQKPKGPAASEPASTKPTIVVRAMNELTGERVLLGDIADLTGAATTTARLAAIDLGAVPALDSRRHLGIWTLTAALRGAGLRDGSYALQVAPDVTIARKGQTVETQTMVDLAIAKAEAYAGVPPTLTVAPPALRAPLGETTMTAVATRAGESELVNVLIDVRVDGKPVGTRTVGFRAKVTGVKTGDAVRVTFALGGAKVETDGKAKSSASLGGSVQVQTADGATVTATVTGIGTVEVRL